jgi:hypothetical protein
MRENIKQRCLQRKLLRQQKYDYIKKFIDNVPDLVPLVPPRFPFTVFIDLVGETFFMQEILSRLCKKDILSLASTCRSMYEMVYEYGILHIVWKDANCFLERHYDEKIYPRWIWRYVYGYMDEAMLGLDVVTVIKFIHIIHLNYVAERFNDDDLLPDRNDSHPLTITDDIFDSLPKQIKDQVVELDGVILHSIYKKCLCSYSCDEYWHHNQYTPAETYMSK